MGQTEEEVNVIRGHMVSLLCDVQAYPAAEITWTKDGQVLKYGSGLQILPGKYYCLLCHVYASIFYY